MVAEYRERIVALVSRAAELQHTSNILIQESCKATRQLRESVERSRAIKDTARELLRKARRA